MMLNFPPEDSLVKNVYDWYWSRVCEKCGNWNFNLQEYSSYCDIITWKCAVCGYEIETEPEERSSNG